MLNQINKPSCTAVTAVHGGIGHNGCPDPEADTDAVALRLFDLLGPRRIETVVPFECGAPWTGHAADAELRRLAKLQRRIELREHALHELKTERRKIMSRCIRRMRRESGKN